MNILSKILTAIETRVVPPRLSIWRTVYFNFRVLPFKQAFHFPFYIYGRVHFPMLAGSVEIVSSRIKKGMIKIGQQDPFSVATGQGFVSVSPNGKLIFYGPACFSTNSCIRVFDGCIHIGRFAWFGSDIKIICNGGFIDIGDYVRCPFQTVIMNSNFHSVVNLKTMAVSPHVKPIVVGEKTWIGNRTTIAGGTKLKAGTIVAAGSYVNKDFTQLAEENQLIGGRPAKLLKDGLARIFSPVMEMNIIKYFDEHPNEQSYQISSMMDEKMADLEKEFE